MCSMAAGNCLNLLEKRLTAMLRNVTTVPKQRALQSVVFVLTIRCDCATITAIGGDRRNEGYYGRGRAHPRQTSAGILFQCIKQRQRNDAAADPHQRDAPAMGDFPALAPLVDRLLGNAELEREPAQHFPV